MYKIYTGMIIDNIYIMHKVYHSQYGFLKPSNTIKGRGYTPQQGEGYCQNAEKISGVYPRPS